jgi:hypothetical protein
MSHQGLCRIRRPDSGNSELAARARDWSSDVVPVSGRVGLRDCSIVTHGEASLISSGKPSDWEFQSSRLRAVKAALNPVLLF